MPIQMDIDDASRLLRTLETDNFLFVIQRSTDNDIIIYNAIREGHALMAPYVESYWTNIGRMRERYEVGMKAKELFFGTKVRKVTTGKYDMLINAIPDRIITIHLRKSGKCTAKAVISGRYATLERIFVNVCKSSLGIGIPSVSSIVIHGRYNAKHIYEVINISEDMINQFDVSSLLPFITRST